MSPLIRNVAITVALLLATYELGLRLFAPPPDRAQNQFSTNIVHLETYMDYPDSHGTVIVGTSLAARIPANSLAPDWQNLAQSGGSTLTGLELVVSSPPMPKRVLIEANFLFIPANESILRAVVDWPQPLLRSLFWFYRTGFGPINLASALTSRHHDADSMSRDFNTMRAMRVRQYTKPVPPILAENLTLIRTLVRQLEAGGTKVGFFEMPLDPSLADASLVKGTREAVRASLDPHEFCWLVLDRGQTYRTVDAMHLVIRDAARIGRALATAPCETPK